MKFLLEKKHYTGIISHDTVEFENEEACRTFIYHWNKKIGMGHTITGYEKLLIDSKTPIKGEIVKNPTDGYVGKLLNGKPAPWANDSKTLAK